MHEHLSAARWREQGRRGWVTLDHGPINLLDDQLTSDLTHLCAWLETRDDLAVVIFESAIEGFFIAHADVRAWVNGLAEPPPPATSPNPWQSLFERYRKLPQATIGIVNGVARGGGCEFLLSLDMRFAVRESAVLGQPEIALGAMPGFGATQYLARLVGRSRALEIVLSGRDLSADEAAEYGLVNRTFPANTCNEWVNRLAEQIASYPPSAIAAAKRAVLAAESDYLPGLIAETDELGRLVAGPDVPRRMRRMLELGGQTPEFERDFGNRLQEFGKGSAGGGV